MTDHWTPLHVFVYSVFVSSWTALGTLLFFSEEPLRVRKIIGCLVFHGLIGGGVGMGAYEFFGWDKRPFRCIVCAIFYGGGIIRISELREHVTKMARALMQSVASGGDKRNES
jgi:hypothetical protein